MNHFNSQQLSNESTGDSFYTPHKNKNVSKIQTNPSSNLSSNPSNQYLNPYSSIQLSQSLNNSPNFHSPSRELGSFITTPNYSISNFPSPDKINGNYRLITESQQQNFLPLKSQIKEKVAANPVRTVTQQQARLLMNLIQQFRIKRNKIYNDSTNIKSLQLRNKFLSKIVQNKQEDVRYHKQSVQQLIRKKKELKKKLKTKKQKIKRKQRNIMEDLEQKISLIQMELKVRQKEFQLQLQKMARLQQYSKQQYENMYRMQANHLAQQQLSFYQHNYQDQMGQFSPHYNQYPYPPYLMHPNQINSQHSSTKRVTFGPTDIYDSNPQTPREQEKYKLNSKHSRQSTGYFGKANFSDISPIASNNINPIQAMKLALAKKLTIQNQSQKQDQQELQQIIGSLKNKKSSPSKDHKSQVQSIVNIQFQQQFQSPVIGRRQTQVSSARKRYGQQGTNTHKRVPSGLTVKIPDYAQSEVNINYQSSQYSQNFNRIYEFSPRIQKQQQQVERRRSPTQQVAPRIFQQIFDSRRNQQQQVQRRRSPTQQFAPKLFQQIADLRKTQKNKNQALRDSGQQTPIFRSQASDSQIRFSQPFLAPFKTSQAIEENVNQNSQQQEDSMMRKSWNKSKSKIVVDKQKDISPPANLHKNFSEVRQIHDSQRAYKPDKQDMKLRRTQKDKQSSSQQEHRNLNDEDDQFWSCTLGADSKISLAKLKSPSNFDDLGQVQSQKLKSSSNSQNFDQFQYMDDEQKQLRKSTPSNIVKVGKSKKGAQNKQSLGDSIKTLNFTTKKKNTQFQAVIQQSQESQQDNRAHTTRKRQKQQDMSKSTL